MWHGWHVLTSCDQPASWRATSPAGLLLAIDNCFNSCRTYIPRMDTGLPVGWHKTMSGLRTYTRMPTLQETQRRKGPQLAFTCASKGRIHISLCTVYPNDRIAFLPPHRKLNWSADITPTTRFCFLHWTSGRSCFLPQGGASSTKTIRP